MMTMNEDQVNEDNDWTKMINEDDERRSGPEVRLHTFFKNQRISGKQIRSKNTKFVERAINTQKFQVFNLNTSKYVLKVS